MRFYKLNTSLNEAIMGKIPTIKSYIYHCDILNEPKFIGHAIFKRVDFDPILVNPVLFSKAKKTDLIERGGQLVAQIIVSGKLKKLIEQNDYGVQYFQCSIFHKDKEDINYWVVNPYKDRNELIDFKKSIIHFKKFNQDTIGQSETIQVASYEEFLKKLEEKEMFDELYLEKILLKEEVSDDFFVLRHTEGGLQFIVSERLKENIENVDCTGIEFQPTELSYNEWVKRDGPRDQVYGRSW